jgi:predicted porin
MGDSLTFSGTVNSGDDLDWDVTMSQEIDGGTLDDFSIGIATPDYGTVTFAGHGKSGPVGAWDDLTPTANEEAWNVAVEGTVDGAANGVSTNDSFHWDYDLPTVDGVALKAAYFPSDNTTAVEGSIEYGIRYTGITDLDVALAMGENNNATAGIDNTVASIKYTMGDVSVGVQANETDSATAGSDEDFRAWGISYLLPNDLQLSYNVSEIDYETSAKENLEATGISFSYTAGSLTWSGAYSEVDNVSGSAASDNSGYELNLSFTF